MLVYKYFSSFSATTLFLCLCSLLALNVSVAEASPLTFRGQNAALFPDANPNATAALMNTVVKPTPKPKPATAIDQNRLIIQGLESQITNKIYNDIFDTHNASGSYQLPGGGSISFVRSGGNIEITIIDSSGATSEITVPDI